MTLARTCGLRAPKAWVEDGVYIVNRFDREADGQKVHVEDMLQVMDLFPKQQIRARLRQEICQAMTNVGVSPAGILEAIKLYAFCYLVGNGNLHGKNVSLIRKSDGQWVPSPAYDIVSTLPYKSPNSGGGAPMALALADDSIGRFELSEFAEFGERFGIPVKASKNAVIAIARGVQETCAVSVLSNRPADGRSRHSVVARSGSLVG